MEMLLLFLNFSLKRNWILKMICITFAAHNVANAQIGKHNRFLEDVSKEGDLSKIQAARFLSDNIPNKFYYDGEGLKNFDVLFNLMEDIQKKRKIFNIDKVFQLKMDSLVNIHGDPMDLELKKIFDSDALSDDFLLENLNCAFKVRKEKNWLKNISENTFYEYLIPYRVGVERLEEHQRAHLYNLYNSKQKVAKKKIDTSISSVGKEMLRFAAEVQKKISKNINLNHTMWGYPFDIPISKMELGKQGACRHLVDYTTAAMRSVGLPVASDFTNRWGNNWTGHKWNVLFTVNGGEVPFDAGNVSMSFNLTDRKVVKVYREQFSPTKEIMPSELDVPTNCFNPYWLDVTRKYAKVTDLKLEIPKEIRKKKKYVLIGTFDNSEWAPQFYAAINKGEATFKNMGVENVYIGMYYEGNELNTFGNPFMVDSLGKLVYFIPKKKSSGQILVRKYPRKNAIVNYEKTMLEAKFYASQDKNFREDDFEYIIKEIPDSVVSIPLPANRYRFITYTFPNLSKPYIAELLIVADGKQLNVKPINSESDQELEKLSDGNLNTYYTGKKGQSIVYDLGKPMIIESIKFAPRSDSNYLINGDVYELCYWNDGNWINMGKKTATSAQIPFSSVPDNALFVLHNLSRGKEERIFSIKDGKQIWW